MPILRRSVVQFCSAPLVRFHTALDKHELAGRCIDRTFAFSSRFAYDSSIGFNHSVGFRSGLSTPYTPAGASNEHFLELPLSLMDNSIFSFPAPPAGRDTLSTAMETGMRLIDEIRYVSGMLVLNWHPHVWDGERYPQWSEAYTDLVRYAQSSGAWFATADVVRQHWLKRRAQLASRD